MDGTISHDRAEETSEATLESIPAWELRISMPPDCRRSCDCSCSLDDDLIIPDRVRRWWVKLAVLVLTCCSTSPCVPLAADHAGDKIGRVDVMIAEEFEKNPGDALLRKKALGIVSLKLKDWNKHDCDAVQRIIETLGYQKVEGGCPEFR